MNKDYYKMISWIALIMAVSTVIGHLIRRMLWTEHPGLFFEGVFYFLLFSGMLLHKTFRSYVLGIPRPYMRFIVISLFLIFTAQQIGRPRVTFPVVPWSMFTHQKTSQDVEYFRYMGEDDLGNSTMIVPSSLFNAIFQSLFIVRLDHRTQYLLMAQERIGKKPAGLVDFNDPHVDFRRKILNKLRIIFTESSYESFEVQRPKYEEYLRAMIDQFNRKYPDKPIKRIKVFRYTLDLDKDQTQIPGEELVWTVERIPEVTP